MSRVSVLCQMEGLMILLYWCQFWHLGRQDVKLLYFRTMSCHCLWDLHYWLKFGNFTFAWSLMSSCQFVTRSRLFLFGLRGHNGFMTVWCLHPPFLLMEILFLRTLNIIWRTRYRWMVRSCLLDFIKSRFWMDVISPY